MLTRCLVLQLQSFAEVFRETVATYPYEKLALIVGATRFGGMETPAQLFSQPVLDAKSRHLKRVFKCAGSGRSSCARNVINGLAIP